MKNDAVSWYYSCIQKFVEDYIKDREHNFSGTTIETIINKIPAIIQGFSDPTTYEEYRTLAKKKDGTLATIQITDDKTGYKLYKPISSEDYKNFYYECLMYSLVYYELFFDGWVYDIIDSENEELEGRFELSELQLPHLLGIEAKYIGNSVIMENIIPGYSGKRPTEQILLIVQNYEKIKEYETKNQIEIFNYYKSMQKIKSFLLLGKLFNEYRSTKPAQYKLAIVNNDESPNQKILYKKSNMNSKMSRSVVKIILQMGEDGNYFARSIQSVAEDLVAIDEAREDLASGVRIWTDLPVDIRGQLLSAGLIFVGEGTTLTKKIKLNESESMINPFVFGIYGVSGSYIKLEEFQKFMDLVGVPYIGEDKNSSIKQ